MPNNDTSFALAIAALNGGGGGGGTTNYNELENKPKINDVQLTGNKSLEDLGIEQPDVDKAYVDEQLALKADESELAGKQDVLTAGTGITIEDNVISATGGGSVAIDNKTIVTDETTGEIKVADGGSGWTEVEELNGVILNGTGSDWDTVYEQSVIDSIFDALNASGKTSFEVQLIGDGVNLSRFVKFVWTPSIWTSEVIGQGGDLHCYTDDTNYQSAELYVNKNNRNIHVYGDSAFAPVLGSKIIVILPEFEPAYEHISIETNHKIDEKYIDIPLYYGYSYPYKGGYQTIIKYSDDSGGSGLAVNINNSPSHGAWLNIGDGVRSILDVNSLQFSGNENMLTLRKGFEIEPLFINPTWSEPVDGVYTLLSGLNTKLVDLFFDYESQYYFIVNLVNIVVEEDSSMFGFPCEWLNFQRDVNFGYFINNYPGNDWYIKLFKENGEYKVEVGSHFVNPTWGGYATNLFINDDRFKTFKPIEADLIPIDNTTITINSDGKLEAQGGGSSYTAGDGIDISSNVISADSTIARVDDIPTVPTNVSAFTNDAGYLTSHQDISNLATKAELEAVEDEIPDITGLATETYVDTQVATKSAVSGTNDGTNWTSLTVDGVTKDIPAGGSGGAVDSVNGQTGTVVLDADDVGALPTTGGTLTGNLVLNNSNCAVSWKDSTFSAGNRIYVDSNRTFCFHHGTSSSPAVRLGSGTLETSIGVSIHPKTDSTGSASLTSQNLGTSSKRWNTLYAINLSDGTTTKTMSEVLAGDTRIPAQPSSDGVYTLQCSIVNGVATYTWVQQQTASGNSF